jgi:3,4-dihydroxy 2-butanone 4-phosphate synthase/GTP cyclohydrolase II
MRSGHTEAAVDLCKLAGLPPVGVICELANDDGTVMTGRQIDEFARAHDLKLVSVSDLIAFRQAREKLVERVATFPVETEAGEMIGHAYVTPFDSVQHFAFVLGAIGDGRDVPTRLHRADIIGDVMCGAPTIKKTLARFAREGRGVLVYLRDGAAGVPANIVGRGQEENAEETRKRQWLDVGLGAQILKDLGVSSIRLRSSSAQPRAFVGLSGFGIEITAVEPVE